MKNEILRLWQTYFETKQKTTLTIKIAFSMPGYAVVFDGIFC